MTGQDYTAWIGRQEIAPPDQISPRLIDSYVTTLAPFLAEAQAKQAAKAAAKTAKG
jgi:hypothetical protein